MKVLKFGLLSFAGILVAFLIFSCGLSRGGDGLSEALEITQGELAFHHFRNYSLLLEEMRSGCIENSIERLDSYILEQKMLMAEIVQSGDLPELQDYLRVRDAQLAEEIESTEVDWSGVLLLGDCTRQ